MVRSRPVSRSIASLFRSQPPSRTSTSDPREYGAKVGYLRENDLFSSLPADEHTWLAESTTMFTCKRGRVFYSPSEQGETIFIIKKGKVNLYRLGPDGRKLVVSSLNSGSIFGEMSMIGQGMYGCYAEAADDCLLCVLSRSDLQALIRRNPDVGLRLLSDMGGRLLQAESELESLAFRPVTNRLASFLIKESDPYGTVAGMSHQEIAEHLGTYRETVSATLGKFRNDNLIAVEPRKIKILDLTGLESIAEV